MDKTVQIKKADWFTRISASRRLAYLLAAAAVASGIATVAIMAGAAPAKYEIRTVVNLLYVDGILLLLLGVVIARRLIQVWQERRKGTAGSGLHTRLVVLFSLVAVTPAIMVAVFSSLFLNISMEHWFSERVSRAVEESRGVANAYLLEYRKNIQTDAFAIANDLNAKAPVLMRNKGIFENVLSSHATHRSLSVAVVIDGANQLLARSRYNLSDTLAEIPVDAMNLASAGEIVVLNTENDDRVRALIRLNRFVDTYLVVERFVDARVVSFMDRINTMITEYQTLEKQRGGIQVSFAAIFMIVALLLLLAAAWIGLTVSTQLANPISALISAAGDVSQGNLNVRVAETEAPDEINSLSRAFNDMTDRLVTQQQGLIDANRELDERRRFTETVLSGVSAGVIGLDAGGKIHLPNRSASELLDLALDDSIGTDLGQTIPEMSDLLEQAQSNAERMHQAEITLMREGQARTLLVRIAAERLQAEVIGFVVTFDDVTELLSAQRKAAWADVARRIAHEIKNPLTPIQLSAERLKRKYLNEIQTDPEVFANCTDTITRQVEDIGRMVDEFSSFARMPQPSLKSENLSEICRQTVFSEENRNTGISFTVNMPKNNVNLRCDALQVSRALTNLLKNAAESILGEGSSDGDAGEITLTLDDHFIRSASSERAIAVIIEDNGRGLPKEQRNRLTEPYVTTRTKGTGLGLAIVKKIMEDHGGDLLLADGEAVGAKITMLFPQAENMSDDIPDNSDEPNDPMKTVTDISVRGA